MSKRVRVNSITIFRLSQNQPEFLKLIKVTNRSFIAEKSGRWDACLWRELWSLTILTMILGIKHTYAGSCLQRVKDCLKGI